MSKPFLELAGGAPRVVAIPRLAAGGRWRVEAMRAISEPMLLWFTKGQGRITVAGVTRGYTANNAIFIPAGVMHGFEVGPQVFGNAVFFGEGCTIPLPQTPQILRIREVHIAQEANVIFEMILREMNSGSLAHERATRHHLGLLGVWLERQVAKAAPEQGKPDAARRLLLAETRMRVGQIGVSIGFTSAAYFARAFQHLTGKSPTDFRLSERTAIPQDPKSHSTY